MAYLEGLNSHKFWSAMGAHDKLQNAGWKWDRSLTETIFSEPARNDEPRQRMKVVYRYDIRSRNFSKNHYVIWAEPLFLSLKCASYSNFWVGLL